MYYLLTCKAPRFYESNDLDYLMHSHNWQEKNPRSKFFSSSYILIRCLTHPKQHYTLPNPHPPQLTPKIWDLRDSVSWGPPENMDQLMGKLR